MKELIERAREHGYTLTRVFPGGMALMERCTGKVVGKYDFIEELEAALDVLPRSTPRAPAAVETVKWRVAAQAVPVVPRTCTNLGPGCLCQDPEWHFCVVGLPNDGTDEWLGCFRRGGCWGACPGHIGGIKLFGDLQANARAKTAYIRKEGMYDELKLRGEGDEPLFNLKIRQMRGTDSTSTALSKADLDLLGELLGVVVRETTPGLYQIVDKDGQVLAASIDRTIIREFLFMD